METEIFGAHLAHVLAHAEVVMKYESAQIMSYRGRWRGQLQYKDESGKWRKTTKVLKATGKRAALRELEAWRDEMEADAERAAEMKALGHEPRETVAEYVERYIDGRAKKVEGATLSTYRGLLRRQIAPFIGSIPLDDLQPDTVQKWVNELTKEYSAVTVRKSFVLLKSAMKQAVDRDRLLKNPTRTVEIPKLSRNKPNSLTEQGRAQLAAFLDISAQTPANLGIRLAFYLGMREGEICALKWRDVDLDAGTLEVRNALGYRGSTYYEKPPKTDGSARVIYLPADVAEAIRRRRADMAAECLEAGTRFTTDLYIIGGVDGRFMHPHQLYRKWRAVADALELVGTEDKPVTFHDLRHTFATTALAARVDVKTVSSILGHANAAMTLNVYASADPDAKRRGAEAVAAAIEEAKKEHAHDGEVLEMGKTGTED